MTGKRKKKQTSPESYRNRTYRKVIDPDGLVSFEVRVRETDLHLLAPADLTAEVTELVLLYRSRLENYIAKHPLFQSSLTPLPDDPLAPGIVKEMLLAGTSAGVGPMAAVAGAVAECVGRDLLASGVEEIMIENGGDIFLCRKKDSLVSIFAGTSPLSNRVGVRITQERMPLGICTSSGTVGHSLSLGKADSVTVFAQSTALADATATRLGNEIRAGDDINPALEIARDIPGLLGVVIIRDQHLGAWGDLELVRIE